MNVILKRNIEEKYRELIEWDTLISRHNKRVEWNIQWSSLARKRIVITLLILKRATYVIETK